MLLDTILKIIPILISATTLIILILGYRKFLQNQLRNKQLDTVYELVKQIQQKDFHYLWLTNLANNNSIPITIATILDIAEMREFDEYEKLYFWGIDTEQPGIELHSWSFFFNFYSHPFLPRSIAIQLQKFNIWRNQEIISYEEVKKTKCIIIGRKQVIPNTATCFYITEGDLKSSKEFKQAAIDLRDSIIEWAKKYNLDDLNITPSHIYNRHA